MNLNLSILPFLLLSNLCLASNLANITVTGNVFATPCEIDSSSLNQTVDFSEILSTDLKSPGTASNWINFSVKLVSCPLTTTSATVYFSGSEDSIDRLMFTNLGTAKNIAIQLVDTKNKSTSLGNGGHLQKEVEPDKTVTFDLSARVYSPNGDASAGTISGVVEMRFMYQ